MLKVKKCTHDYKPHQFIRCEHDDYGNTIYVYEVQCMKCGKKPFFLFQKSKNQMLELHDFFDEIAVGISQTGKSKDIGADKHY